MTSIVKQGVEMSLEAARNVEECAVDVAADIANLNDGTLTPSALLAVCLDGADEDREQGWRDYVEALTAATVEG